MDTSSRTRILTGIGISLLVLAAGSLPIGAASNITDTTGSEIVVMSFSQVSDNTVQNESSSNLTNNESYSEKKPEGMTERRLFQIRKASSIPSEYLVTLNDTAPNRVYQISGSQKPCPGLTCGR